MKNKYSTLLSIDSESYQVKDMSGSNFGKSLYNPNGWGYGKVYAYSDRLNESRVFHTSYPARTLFHTLFHSRRNYGSNPIKVRNVP
jgi:hypothetical protein